MDRWQAIEKIENNLKERKNRLACYNACKAWKISLVNCMQGKCMLTLRLLLEAGYQYGIDDSLCYTSEFGHVEETKLLLKYGADVHCYNDFSILYATIGNHIEVAEVLLEAGASVGRVGIKERAKWVESMTHEMRQLIKKWDLDASSE